MPTAPVVHPSAVLQGEIDLAPGVVIGPHCVLTGRVKLAEGVRLVSHVCIQGPVQIGANTRIHPFTSIGFTPQDVKWKDDHVTAGVRIGADTQIRENVTLHAASKPDQPTSIGDRCFLMVGCHLGHDAKIGNDVILVNNVLLAGHSEVGDKATLGGAAAVHQFTRVGRMAFISGMTAVAMDVPPFCMSAERNHIHGINLVGLRRNGVSRDEITLVRKAFRKAFRPTLPRKEQIQILEEIGRESPIVTEMADFVKAAKRSISAGTARPPRSLITWLHYAKRGKHLPGLEEAGEEVG
jgi:UDP-N-acetylglucosamine acyltransferase